MKNIILRHQAHMHEYYIAAPSTHVCYLHQPKIRKQDIGGRGVGWYLEGGMSMNDFAASTLDLGLERSIVGAWRR
jgi:hypothetical protein